MNGGGDGICRRGCCCCVCWVCAFVRVRTRVQVWALAQHQYVHAWKHLEDAMDNVTMYLARKPRYAQPLFERFAEP